MKEIKHIYVTVDTDMIQKYNFIGTLADFACQTLNMTLPTESKLISINETTWSNQVQPTVDYNTWYTRDYLKLSVYYEV